MIDYERVARDLEKKNKELEKDVTNAAECMDYCLREFGNFLSGTVGGEVKDEMIALKKKYVNNKA